MPYERACPHCGHIERVYFHKLNKPMVLALKKLCDMYLEKRKRIKLVELNLNNNDFSNFQKIKYWGLVHRDEHGWIPTRRAFMFFRGDFSIPEVQATLNNQVLKWDDEAWKARSKANEIVSIKDYDIVLDNNYENINYYLQ